MIKKVLFVPCPTGGSAHFIPLLALNRMLKRSSIDTAFLVSRSLRPLAELFQIKTLDIDHQPLGPLGFRTEMRAYSAFSPDVVVDDTCLTTGFASVLARCPRVTIQRTGAFPHALPPDPGHHHSLEGMNIDWSRLPDVTFLGLPQPRELSDFFAASRKIVPGIRSVEVLPPQLEHDDSYVFSGPLLVEDFLIEAGREVATSSVINASKREIPIPTPSADLGAVERFLAANQTRRRVYVTLGTVASATDAIRSCIRALLELGMAVISTVDVDDLPQVTRTRFFCGVHLPMHLAVRNVDLMIHQCGSGTYQYPILHTVPSLTIGTQCHDREAVAKRLQALGVSTHLASPAEEPAFQDRFRAAVDEYFANDGARLTAARSRLSTLREETSRTAASFDFEKVLETAVSQHSAPRRLG